jgi:hypothetical protein
MTELGFLKVADGNLIKVTEDMFEDFHILSSTYGVSIRELISSVFDGEWIAGDEVKNYSKTG